MEFTISANFEVPAKEIYEAWLDSDKHTQMTGGGATASVQVQGAFTAWDGYIQGVNLELDPYQLIRQSWRTVEFEPSEPDSILEIHLQEKDGITNLTLIHKNLPAHGAQYEQGWEDNYFVPMRAYFT